MTYERVIRSLVLAASCLTFVAKGNAQLLVLSPFGNRSEARASRINVPPTPVEGVLTITAASGADISKAAIAAFAAARSTCGTITIAPGVYTWATAGVQMPPCETLIGTGATILVDTGGTSQPAFLIVEGPAPAYTSNSTYTVGNIRGITFVGPSAPSSQSSSTGLELGGTTPAQTAQLINLYDVHIHGFGCGINIQWAFQIAFFGGSIEGNYDGICFSNIVGGLENINFHGTQILNNVDYGINQDQTGVFAELNLISCSLDYNGQNQPSGGQVQIVNGKLNILGGHFENNRLPMLTIPVPGAPVNVSVFITGTAFNVTDLTLTDTYAGFFSVKGVNSVLELGRGISFSSLGTVVSAVADWEPTINQNSRLFMDPYTYVVVTTPEGLPGFTGTAPNNYKFATYDTHDNVTGTSSSY